RPTAAVAARGLAAHGDPEAAKLILRNYYLLAPEERPGVIDGLVSRPEHADALLRAVAEGEVARAGISAYHVRQIRSLGKADLDRRLAKVWGEVRGTPEEKRKEIARYKALLTPDRLKGANLPAGRALFNQHCASCHVLYGQGKQIGPDLTGGN